MRSASVRRSRYWAERKRRILIIAPASLRQQWKQELYEKFLIPSELLDAKSKATLLANKAPGQVLIASYEIVQQNKADLMRPWDLVVADEAHRLRNFYKGRKHAKVACLHTCDLTGQRSLWASLWQVTNHLM